MFLFLCENLKKKYRQILASSKPLFFINPIGILEGILGCFFFWGGWGEEGIWVNFPTKKGAIWLKLCVWGRRRAFMSIFQQKGRKKNQIPKK